MNRPRQKVWNNERCFTISSEYSIEYFHDDGRYLIGGDGINAMAVVTHTSLKFFDELFQQQGMIASWKYMTSPENLHFPVVTYRQEVDDD